MKNLTLSLMFLLFVSFAPAQSEKSTTYEAGYTLGYYTALLWPYAVAVAIVCIIYRVIRKKRQVKA